MKYLLLLFCLVAAISVSVAQAQSAEQAPSLRQQYANLKSNQEVINGFRMVKLYDMDQLWRVIEDSLRTKRAAINEGLALVAKQEAEINELKASLVQIEAEKQALVSGVENINIFGKPYAKGGFVTLVTCLIIGLVIACAALFVFGKLAHKASSDSKKAHEDLYKEFEDYKHLSVEKNIKLSRELQSLKNRMAELKIA